MLSSIAWVLVAFTVGMLLGIGLTLAATYADDPDRRRGALDALDQMFKGTWAGRQWHRDDPEVDVDLTSPDATLTARKLTVEEADRLRAAWAEAQHRVSGGFTLPHHLDPMRAERGDGNDPLPVFRDFTLRQPAGMPMTTQAIPPHAAGPACLPGCPHNPRPRPVAQRRAQETAFRNSGTVAHPPGAGPTA